MAPAGRRRLVCSRCRHAGHRAGGTCRAAVADMRGCGSQADARLACPPAEPALSTLNRSCSVWTWAKGDACCGGAAVALTLHRDALLALVAGVGALKAAGVRTADASVVPGHAQRCIVSELDGHPLSAARTSVTDYTEGVGADKTVGRCICLPFHLALGRTLACPLIESQRRLRQLWGDDSDSSATTRSSQKPSARAPRPHPTERHSDPERALF